MSEHEVKLAKAMEYFVASFKELNGKDARVKSKYGTMRLELEHTWIQNEKDERDTLLSLLLTASRYPDMAHAILNDSVWELKCILDFNEAN